MVRAPVYCGDLYGSKQEKNVFFRESLQEACFVITDVSEISGNLREFTGECNLGILYSNSISMWACAKAPLACERQETLQHIADLLIQRWTQTHSMLQALFIYFNVDIQVRNMWQALCVSFVSDVETLICNMLSALLSLS